METQMSIYRDTVMVFTVLCINSLLLDSVWGREGRF